MEWLLGLLASIIVAYATAQLSLRAQREKMRAELKLEYSIETAIERLMKNPDYKKRSLKKIKHHIRGFKDDDDLRMHLIRAGAVAFGGEGDQESWGLLIRNEDDVK